MSAWVTKKALSNVLPCLRDDHGLWLEFGVWKGETMRQIAEHRQHGHVYGFDSFRGLPEAWGSDHAMSAGAFDMQGRVPFPETKTIKWQPGWFNVTLPIFLNRAAIRHKPVRFIHIDCDLYSSTKCVFDELKDRLVPGVYLTFDELFNYPDYKEHEMRALWEMLRDRQSVYPTMGVEVVSTSTRYIDPAERPNARYFKFQAASLRLYVDEPERLYKVLAGSRV